MKGLTFRLERAIALCLVALLAVPLGLASTAPLGTVPAASDSSTKTDMDGSDPGKNVSEYPDSPGTEWAQANQQSQQPASSPSTPINPQQPGTSQSTPADQQTSAPVGTAAAPYVKADGVTAARPTGAAIAPGKQKRSHSLAIKVGLLVGGAIAIGTVAGLSLASSSKPH